MSLRAPIQRMLTHALAWVLIPVAAVAADEPQTQKSTATFATSAAEQLQAIVGSQAPNGFASEPALSWIALVRDPADESLGATLEPVGDPVRAQLDIPKGTGLVVALLSGDGPAAQAGLKEKDILLNLRGKPLTKSEDFMTGLKEGGENDVSLEVLRKGKRETLSIRPVYRVTIGPSGKETTDYFIGLPVSNVDDTLRSHLDLPAGVGLVVNEVQKDSPSEKAGVKPHDILLELAGKPLDSTETLVAAIQEVKDRATTLKVLRGGKTISLPITPAKRVNKASPAHGAYRVWTTQADDPHAHLGLSPYLPHAVPQNQLQNLQRHGYVVNREAKTTAPEPSAKRLDSLADEVKALRKAVDELRNALTSGKGRE